MNCKDLDIVLLSTADWDNPFWTNKQHVAVELARRGNRILYIDSLGLRRPSASAQDMSRIARRLLKAALPPRKVLERVWVWSPALLPWQGFAIARFINRLVISGGLSFWLMVLRFRQPILWTYNPMTMRFLGDQKFKMVVYHCVDEIKAQPGMPAQAIENAEKELLRVADICFVTAPDLLPDRQQLNPNTHYFSNVADFEHFSLARNSLTTVPEDLACLPVPRIGFIGAISGYKMDFPLLCQLAAAHPEWSLVLIGKVGEGDPRTSAESLRKFRNIHFLGPRLYSELPAYLKGFSVAILPSALNDYTRGMFPMKFFEYLAAGCPVVSTDLPALRDYSGVASLARTPGEFIQAVERSVAGEGASLEDRLSAARGQTYEARTARMMRLIDAIPLRRERA